MRVGRKLHVTRWTGHAASTLQVMTTKLLQKHWEWQQERTHASHAEAWQRGAADHVLGKLGHQDGVRPSKTEARGKENGEPRHTRMVNCDPPARDVLERGDAEEASKLPDCGEREKGTSDWQFCGHKFWIMSYSKGNLEWWTSTYEPEESADLSIDTRSGLQRFPLKKISRSWDVL